MDVRAYLEAGKAMEGYWNPWTPDGPSFDKVFDFIADARERLPLYRQALEAILTEIDQFEKDWEWEKPVNLDHPLSGELESIRWAFHLVRWKIEQSLFPGKSFTSSVNSDTIVA